MAGIVVTSFTVSMRSRVLVRVRKNIFVSDGDHDNGRLKWEDDFQNHERRVRLGLRVGIVARADCECPALNPVACSLLFARAKEHRGRQ